MYVVDFLDEHRHMLEERLQPILREITDTRARSKEEIDSEYGVYMHTYHKLI